MKQLILIFIFSCASLIPKDINKDHFKIVQSAQCLTGEGTGRIEMGAERYGFDYQSKLETEDHWILVVEVPFQGEEVLEIVKKDKGYLFDGSFYRKLKLGYREFIRKNPDFGARSLDQFLTFMAEQIFNFRKYQKMSAKQSDSYFLKWCKETPVKVCDHATSKTRYLLEPDLFKVQRKQNDHTLIWENTRLSMQEKFFKRSEIALNKDERNLMKAILYPNKCQNETSGL